MAINSVGSYNNYAAVRTAPPVRPAAAPAAPAAYTAAPTGGAVTTQSGEVSLGRLASWAGGAWASWKYVLPMIGRQPGGLLIAGVLGAGAYAGNWLYNKVTGTGNSNPVGGSGETMRYASWAGGAAAAWKWVLPMIGRPTALMTAGVLGAGAFAGNWIYNKLTGR